MMMKIHTTQDLNSLAGAKSTNMLSSNGIRLNYSEQMRKQNLLDEPDSYESGVSFKGSKNPIKDGKKIVKSIKKLVGDISKDPQLEKEKGDGLLKSPFFNKIVNVADYETVATASVAAIACALRAATIATMPSKGKSKEDNIYAAGQALSSGIAGFITAFVLTAPFKAGASYTRDKMLSSLRKETLERLHPQLKGGVIEQDGKRILDPKQWEDKFGNNFSTEIKMCDMLPQFKSLSEVSETTFSKILGVDVDWAAQKGKSFNEVVLKDGRTLYDVIDMSRLGFVVEEEGKKEAQILFRDVDKEYLANLIKDAEGTDSVWKDLDINSVFKEDGNVADFRQWKNKIGEKWKLDLDSVYVSSPLETANYRPRISGKRQLDSKENIYKFTTYQKNGVNGACGSEITEDMINAERSNEGINKLLTWGPDLLFRVPVAAGTVALIPWVLKNVFNIEKSSAKKLPENNLQEKLSDSSVKPEAANVSFKGHSDGENSEQVSFKGKSSGADKANWFVRKFGELYGKPLLESEKVGKLAERVSKLPGSTSQHMVALGSLITSGTYVQQTLTKKDLDPNRRRTLAVNQSLCFVVPTIAAYTVDSLINGWIKKKEYRFTGLQNYQFEMDKLAGKLSDKEVSSFSSKLGKKAKGIRILSSLTVFTLIYRYATPVLITPVANKIGDWWNARIETKKDAKKVAQ